MENKEVRISRVSMGSIALFEGIFAAEIGLGLTIAAWISTSAGSTSVVNSVLRGMTFGLHPGLGAVILGTIYYFIGGLVVGFINGALFNWVTNWMGGIEVATREAGEETMRPMVATGSTRTLRPEPTFGETIDHRRVDR